MSDKPTQKNSSGWYLSYEVLYFEIDELPSPQNYEIWENHILIKACDPEEAYEKAMSHGLDNEQELRINNKKGHLKFKGLKNLIKIYDELEDGAEIEWREYESSRDELETLITSKQQLHAFQPLPSADEYG